MEASNPQPGHRGHVNLEFWGKRPPELSRELKAAKRAILLTFTLVPRTYRWRQCPAYAEDPVRRRWRSAAGALSPLPRLRGRTRHFAQYSGICDVWLFPSVLAFLDGACAGSGHGDVTRPTGSMRSGPPWFAYWWGNLLARTRSGEIEISSLVTFPAWVAYLIIHGLVIPFAISGWHSLYAPSTALGFGFQLGSSW